MNRRILILSVIVVIILAVFVFEKLQPPLEMHVLTILSRGGTEAGDNATDFILESFNGTDIKLDSFIGKKAIVLHFWSLESAGELTQLQTVRNFFGDKVEIIGVYPEIDSSKARNAVKDMALTFPMLIDPTGQAKQAYEVFITPTTYFIDTSGVITDKKEGALTEQELNEKLKLLIK
ncbi:MAG: TlpA family protein disulfide reductase [Candidatus Aenigmarchaeota archaeon]|nr:TlpA family protein disulfide reductase [Candidatus Aenigmarchaeota archaeon]